MTDQLDVQQLDEFVQRLKDSQEPAESVIQVRDAVAREIDMRIVPWEVPAISKAGPEVIMRGAFDGVDPAKVVLRMQHKDPPVGRGMSYENRPDGAYMTFKVAGTLAGDEAMQLASERIVTGVSPSFQDAPGGVQIHSRSGVRLRVVHKARLREAALTWLPTWDEAMVLETREQEDAPVTEPAAEAPVTPAPQPVIDFAPITELITQNQALQQRQFDDMADKFAKLEERSRMDIQIPTVADAHTEDRAKRGDWMQAVLTMLSGNRPNELQMRELADLITTDNVGVVPDAYLTELIGVIDPSRPFLNSTRRLDLPAAGMSLVVPKIVTRPTTGVQAAEKDELTSTATNITTATFDAVTIGGVGDISLQLLKRSSPSFLSLYLELLAESLARNAEIEALQALLAGGVVAGGAMDAEDLSLGAAWTTGSLAGVPPDTIWLSTEAVGAFIDAKADGTNAPLYSSIQAGFTAGAGPVGTISGLRPVHVPALDTASATIDVIVGPSRGFGWTEDGAYTLQVDVPAKAGRDVALVSLLWFAPMYPGAFTTFTIAS